MEPTEDRIGLSNFLADLRSELHSAQERALAGAGGLRLGVEEITVTLEVMYERTVSGELGSKVSGKFWLFGSAEASVKASKAATRGGTQTLTLTLRPRIETTSHDDEGRVVVTHEGLDVTGAVGSDEERAPATRRTSSGG